MAVKIRLMRVGKKKQPTYRVVVTDARSPRDGRFIEVLGQYAPRAEPSVVTIDTDRALHWLNVGAQPTEQVGKLLEIAGVWDAYKDGERQGRGRRSRRRRRQAEEPSKEAPRRGSRRARRRAARGSAAPTRRRAEAEPRRRPRKRRPKPRPEEAAATEEASE